MADSLGFRLSLDSKEFEIKIDNAGRLLNRLSNQGAKAGTGVKRLEGGVSSFGRTLSDTITTIGMASFAIGTLKSAFFDWQKTILDSAGKLERLQVMLQGLATSSDKAAESMRDFNFIVDKAKNAPFSIESISDSFVKLKSAGIDPTKGSLDAMVDSVARFGGNSELLKRATIAIQQMSGKGVVSMEELRQQLGEAIPTAMQSMATSMNLSMGELTKAISSGQVEATTAIKGMLNVMELSYRGSAQRMMSTYSGLISQIETNAALLAKSISDAGYMDAVKDALKDVNRLLMSDAASYYGKQFGDMAKGFIDAAREMMIWVVNNQSMLTSLLQILLAIGGAKIFLSFFKTAIGSITSFNMAIAGAITGGGGFIRHIYKAAERSQRLGGSLNIATVAIGQMTHAWRGLNMAMKANIIIAAIATVIEIVIALAWWFGQAEQKANDATEAARNMPSMVTDEQLGLLKSKLNDQQKALDKSNKELKAAIEFREQLQDNKKRGLWVSDGAMERAGREHSEALKKQQNALKEHGDNLALIQSSEISRAKEHMRKKLDLVMEENQKETDVRQADYRKRVTDIEKQRDAELKANEGISEKQDEIRKKAAEELSVAYDEEAEAQKKGLEKVRDSIDQQQGEINKKIAARTAELGDAVAEKNDLFLKKLISQKEEIGKHYTDIANQINTLAQMVKDGKALMFNGWKGLNGSNNSGSDDSLEKQLATVRKNNERLSLGDRIDNGEKIQTIDGRIAKGRKEAEASFQIIEAMVGKKIAVDNLSEAYGKLSAAQKKEADAALANARIQDEADRRKLAASSTHQGESKEAKAKRFAEKMAEENKKILDQAESMAAKVGFGSVEVAKYNKAVGELTNSLTKLSKSKPEDGILNQEQIDKAKVQLAEITAGAQEYEKALTKDSADQLISKWAGFSKTVVGNMTQGVAEMRQEFERNYEEADKYFAKIIKANEKNEEITKYLKAEQAKFHAAKEEAKVRMTETATAKMAYDYQNLGKLIDDNIKSVFDNLEDKLMNFLETGKFNIADFGNFIFQELQRSFIRSMVISPMINELGLGARGDTGAGLVSKVGSAMSGMFGGSSSKEDESGVSKSTQALGKAATETTGALETMQSQGIFATLAGYGQQLWAMIAGTTATQTKAASDVSATATVVTFATALGMATTALTAFIASTSASSASSGIGSILSMAATVGGAVAGGAGGGAAAVGSGASGSAANVGAMGLRTNYATTSFAKGGIMSALGEIPLKAYAKGGIATSPQLALFGEGKYNEAYVPLPDGRSIPVNMNVSGDGGSGGVDGRSVVISIAVNNHGGEKDEKSKISQDAMWNDTAQRIKSIVIETMTEEKRPGGMLTE
ncbi:tape measure protein [Xenorhabdus bovienii]|uniref:tape measure protein n=1 Tax=Xenorhabdus bovienii TaxID=40576 RepID=UPI0023B22F2B|nr:tape measure protein [Xenorhabdus bovienii]MDE9568829.1 tape measure protein [Xenorhabdus bovienii]